jgi:predicted O-methyltransferase YrrM
MITAYDLTDGAEPMTHREINYLKMLAANLPLCPLIVNIGAADGVSTCAFLEARPDALIYSVDVEPCPQEFEHLEACGLDPNCVMRLLGDSKQLGLAFEEQCDLLYIDGDHWNAAGDIEAWVKTGKVKSNGIVAFHDWQEICPENNPGAVYEQVNEHMAGYVMIGHVDRVIAFRMP